MSLSRERKLTTRSKEIRTGREQRLEVSCIPVIVKLFIGILIRISELIAYIELGLLHILQQVHFVTNVKLVSRMKISFEICLLRREKDKIA